MREIKFRAWDTLHECFITAENGYQYIFDSLTSTWFSVNGSDIKLLNFNSELVLMQFTGLRDVNGTEIYEGDIILSIGVEFKVGFKNGSFSAEYSDNDEDHFYLGNANETTFEVIGNIYQPTSKPVL